MAHKFAGRAIFAGFDFLFDRFGHLFGERDGDDLTHRCKIMYDFVIQLSRTDEMLSSSTLCKPWRRPFSFPSNLVDFYGGLCLACQNLRD